ncbi:cell division control protein Cdc6 [Neurospora crassa]|uniref:Cell division control protein n=1 Tax=Neurospora crassa (strain ATCC 24698 / 74-OR23-1A / CBS 708.71 / DSM 1257 / FGSC 987) TaxID=367110 RepID=Q7SE18_NEUCR|nr:cell division control protein Cdc6 [Neurospora crassa OR74A]EAA35035.2 cell division control protein Cdc6 [Neurospora crassa OR74A]KHE87291.1 cell division control protein Cdc6 [Neurospora crassa]|eukprot:XP_964271.2 cell division control protein Cdc6 [Neurospora crassa OR74A]
MASPSAPTTLGKRRRSTRLTDEEITLGPLAVKRTRRSLRIHPEIHHEPDHIQAEKEKAASPPKPTADEDVENHKENRKPTGDEDEDRKEAETPAKSLLRRRKSVIASPPKTAPVTPSTPRHYDVFARVPVTTPRHRVMSVGKLSRRMTPSTPMTPAASQTVYHQARQLFSRSADPGELIGRDDEREKLNTFLDCCTTAHPSGCLYVSGPPGTGKSAIVNKVTDKFASETSTVRKAYINCMSIKSSKDLYVTLLDQLVSKDEDKEELSTESDVVAALQKLILPRKKTQDVFLVVLDEIDHILTLDPESLYSLFEWSLEKKNSRLALIGIANALDLTDRFLPRLKSRNLKPELLPILPYTAPQVKNIIITRLKSLLPGGTPKDPNYIPFFHPAAIELCSRKVSSQTGDLRRAFEICRRAIDLVESETRLKHENEVKEQMLQMSPSKKRVLGENTNLSSAPAPSSLFRSISTGPSASVSASLLKSLQALTPATAPRVSIADLSKVTAAAFSNGTTQRLKTLNLQQKAALCALVAIEKRNRAAQSEALNSASASFASTTGTPSRKQEAPIAPTVKTLFEAYTKLCKQDSLLHPLSSSEFREVVSSLETLSLITPVDGKTGSFTALGYSSPGVGTPKRGGKKKKDVFGMGGALVAGDEKRVASCVGEREVEQTLLKDDGAGVGILRGILSGEALDD